VEKIVAVLNGERLSLQAFGDYWPLPQFIDLIGLILILLNNLTSLLIIFCYGKKPYARASSRWIKRR